MGKFDEEDLNEDWKFAFEKLSQQMSEQAIFKILYAVKLDAVKMQLLTSFLQELIQHPISPIICR